MKGNRFTALVDIAYPIVQGPFGGRASSVALTQVVSEMGGLGSYGCQPHSASEIIEIAGKIREQTDKPFNLNLWVNDYDDAAHTFSSSDLDRILGILKPYFDEVGAEFPTYPLPQAPRYADQLEAIFAVKPRVFSFVYGIPSSDILEHCRRLNILTLGTATTVDEAIALENAGVDAIVASGADAGGHRVSFLDTPENSLVGTFSLIPQVADAVKIPVVAAGGISDARGVGAALQLGADAVQIGTAFLATQESGTSQGHKDILFTDKAKYTTLTKVFTGRLSRGLANRLTEELKNYQEDMAPYPLQGKIIGKLGAYPANIDSNPELKSLWAGQAAALVKHRDARTLITELIKDLNW